MNKVVTSSYSQEGRVYDVYMYVSIVADVERHTQKQINSRSLVDRAIADLRRQFNF